MRNERFSSRLIALTLTQIDIEFELGLDDSQLDPRSNLPFVR